ncbi:MAG: restriction endonuclease, partial [Candidatus Hydrogenedentes bacterium]|nr:restriction endonuclease [Candidatus Hydrogenedentota bacterium]
MQKLDWKTLDDYRFVRLVGEILSRRGFIDIDYQGGRGQDGGIDLFATEPVGFAMRGPVPYRWAIQCKYSSKGTSAKSVNDSEIKDVT